MEISKEKKPETFEQNPEIVERLTNIMNKYVSDGRSTPGAKQTNEGRSSRI